MEFIFILFWLIIAFYTASKAGKLGYSYLIFFILGLLFPILSLIVLFILSKFTNENRQSKFKIRASFFIALRYIWGRAKEGGRYLRGAAAGIAVSLIPIIVTLIVSDGMIKGIMDRYLEFGTGHVQVYSYYDSEDDEYLINTIKNFKGTRGVWLERKGMGLISGKEGKAGVTIRAVEPSFWEDPGSAGLLHIIDGEASPKTERDIVLGETLANNIGVKVGDNVGLMTIRAGESGNFIPRTALFTVRGIISCGYNELDALWCIISWEGGLRAVSPEQSNDSLIIKINDPYEKADEYKMELFMELDGRYNVYTWKELLISQYNSYMSTKQLLLFIMALIVIVAAINVSSATSMLVFERQKDIAILKISGGNIYGIADIFLCGSFLTGLIGSIIGISLGLLIGVNINNIIRSLEKILSFVSGLFNGSEVRILDPGFYLETIPIIVDWNAVIAIWALTIICSMAASWIPALRAGKLKPMELLRKN